MDTQMSPGDGDRQHPYSHADKERLFGCQARGRVLLNQRQRAEAKLVNGLVGIQGRKISVDLTVVLSDMETVGIDVVAETKTTRVYSGGKLEDWFSSADQHRSLDAVENRAADTQKPLMSRGQICPSKAQTILLP